MIDWVGRWLMRVEFLLMMQEKGNFFFLKKKYVRWIVLAFGSAFKSGFRKWSASSGADKLPEGLMKVSSWERFEPVHACVPASTVLSSHSRAHCPAALSQAPPASSCRLFDTFWVPSLRQAEQAQSMTMQMSRLGSWPQISWLKMRAGSINTRRSSTGLT